MERVISIVFVCAAFAAGCAQPPVASEKPAKPVVEEPAFESEFDRLVWRLGDPNYDKRIEAHMELLEMGDEIIPRLTRALETARGEDHRRQIEILISELETPNIEERKANLLVRLSTGKESYQLRNPIKLKLTITNTGNTPLKLTVPLLRKYSVAFRLDWQADMTFSSGGKPQKMVATGKTSDEWLAGGSWNPSTLEVRPGDSISETIDISDMCNRAARYTATATYRWLGKGDFVSNAVSFQVEKSPQPPDSSGGGR